MNKDVAYIMRLGCLLAILLLVVSRQVEAEVTGADEALSYQTISRKYANHPQMQAFKRRLELINDVKKDIEQSFTQQRQQALDNLLDDTLGTDLSLAPVSQSSKLEIKISAVDLLKKYSKQFSTSLEADAFAEDEQTVLLKEYSRQIRKVSDQVAQRAQSVAAANPDQAMRVMALSLVLPLLHVPDEYWQVKDLEGLPGWVQESINLVRLEDFALRAHRPMTAYVFASESFSTTNESETRDLKTYLEEAGGRLLREERYDDAIQCFEVAKADALKRDDYEYVNETIFREAQILDDIGRHEDAVAMIQPLLTHETKGNTFGKAAMLHLKYLYSGKNYGQVLNASVKYQEDERSQNYLPQILYITWVAARLGNAQTLADVTRKKFVKTFPDHILAADMYFSQAMNSLARSDYQDCQRIIEYIIYKYPNSRLIKRVKEIKERITKSTEVTH